MLIIGCGDIGLRIVSALGRHRRVLALTSSTARVPELHAAGVLALRGNLDDPLTLGRLAGLATQVLHLAPPPSAGVRDPRTRNLVHALARRSPPRVLVYASTSGVYGDCAGAWVGETSPLASTTPRAQRRADAEARLRQWGLHGGARIGVLRIAGIYAADRPGGGPRARLQRAQALPHAATDPYVNHIHADDLAHACMLALWRCRPQRTYNIADHSALRMGEYLDLAADLLGLARLPRGEPALQGHESSPAFMSFWGESRRLIVTRMEHELGVRLRYQTVKEGLSVQCG